MADGCDHEANCSPLGWPPIVPISSSDAVGIFRLGKVENLRTVRRRTSKGWQRRDKGSGRAKQPVDGCSFLSSWKNHRR